MSYELDIFSTKQDNLTGAISGTTNQVNVSANSNSVAANITLSLPQSINTTATPTFNQVTLNNAPVNNTDAASKKYVDDAVAGENLWDRSGTTLSPHTAGDGIAVDKVLLNTTYTTTGVEATGTRFWDAAKHTTTLALENGGRLQDGYEGYIYGKNLSGSIIANGQPVAIAAANGSFTAFTTVDITTPAAYAFAGLATEEIAINGFGRVTKWGEVNDIDTSHLDEGKPVYVSAAGLTTKTFPTVPNYIINVGVCDYKHAQHGRINVVSSIVPKLGDLSDVDGTPLTVSGQLPVWNNTGKYFDFTSKVGDFEPTLTKGNLTESTSSVLTIGSGTGAVIGNGTTIQVKQADTTNAGYLSSADWNTFNGKEPALTKGNLTETTTSSLTITGGTGAVIGSGTTIALPQDIKTNSSPTFTDVTISALGRNSVTVGSDTKMNTGVPWEERGKFKVGVTYSGGNVIATISFVGANTSFSYYIKDKKFTVTNTELSVYTATAAASEGVWFFYINQTTTSVASPVMSLTKTPWGIVDPDVLLWNFYFNATANTITWIGEERHTAGRDIFNHARNHAQGAIYKTGLLLSAYNGITNTALGTNTDNNYGRAQFQISGGTFFDEDIPNSIAHTDTSYTATVASPATDWNLTVNQFLGFTALATTLTSTTQIVFPTSHTLAAGQTFLCMAGNTTTARGTGTITAGGTGTTFATSTVTGMQSGDAIVIGARIPIYYVSAVSGSNYTWRKLATSDFMGVSITTSAAYTTANIASENAAYNNATAGGFLALTANRHYPVYLCATNSTHEPVIAIFGQGQSTSGTLATSLGEAPFQFVNLVGLSGLSIQEIVPFYRLTYIYNTSGAFSTTRIKLVDVTFLNVRVATVSGSVLGAPGSVVSASSVNTDTTNFSGWLSTANTTVQSALDTLDDLTAGVKTDKIYPTADSTTAVQINKADGTTNILNIDTTNSRVGIGNTTPDLSLQITGASNAPDANGAVGKGVLQIGDTPLSATVIRMGYVTGNRSWIQGYGGKPLTINELGNNVGIGTTAPGARLEVDGAKDTYGDAVIRATDTTALAAGVGGSISFTGKYTTGGAFAQGGAISSYKINATSNDYSFGMKFLTRNHGSTPATAMTIDNLGNVGIGTTAPSAPLELSHNSGETLVLRKSNNEPYISFTGTTNAQAAIDSLTGGGFRVYTGNGAQTEKMRITATGNVGIGTTAPLSKLSINGGLHVGGDSDAGDNNLLVDGTATVTGLAGVGDRGIGVDANGLLKIYSPAGGGDVIAPATNTADYIPQWNGANSKTLKDGLAFSTTTTLGTSDTTISSQKAVKTYADTKIASAIVDAKGDIITATADNTPARLAVSATNGQLLQADSSASTGLSYVDRANPNYIINGNFDFWQRGTSATALGSYLADRFNVSGAGSSATFTQQSFTVGQTDVPNNPKYYHRTVVTSSAGAGNFILMYYPVENVRTLANSTVTLSFYAKADASKNIAVEFVQNFGTGGSPSADVNISPSTIALTTSWAKKTVTVSLPSISGKTLGSNGNDKVYIIFWLDAGSSFNSRTNTLGQQSGTFEISQVKLEEGSVATPFVLAGGTIQGELAACQRYYEKSYDATTNPGTSTGVGGVWAYSASTSELIPNTFLRVSKRSIPTIVLYAEDGTANAVRDITAGANVTTVVGANIGQNNFRCYKSAGFTDDRMFLYHFTADAEL